MNYLQNSIIYKRASCTCNSGVVQLSKETNMIMSMNEFED